ncbi:MAG: hypothetical protein WCA97_01140 [Terriglobales bacterium]
MILAVGMSAVVLLLHVPMKGQEVVERFFKKNPQTGHIGLPVDWSTRHILFTAGGTPEDEAATANDPRRWINDAVRRHIFRPAPMETEGSEPERAEVSEPALMMPPSFPERPGIPRYPWPLRAPLRRDWAVSTGSTAGGYIYFSDAPAKYNFNVNGTYSCANDFLVYAIAVTPSSTVANIVAFNNLYTGTASSSCPNAPQTPPSTNYTAPKVMWAYQAGSARLIGSPVFSLDGTKVAFIEDNGSTAMLDVLTWVSGQGTVTAPATPGTGGSSLVRLSYTNTTTSGCTASASGNTQSSPYVDYDNDVAYVGDNNGRLYRITGIFKGTPTLQYCVSMPVNTSGVRFTTSPVYISSEQASIAAMKNTVYISDGTYLFAYTPGSSSFSAVANFPIQIESTSGTFKAVEPPTADASNGFIYLFSAGDMTLTNSIVSQINLNVTPPTQATVAIGPSSNAYMFALAGDFDNGYFSSGPKTGAGTLYACGTEPGSSNGDVPSLYAISFTSGTGVINTTPAMSNNLNINSSGNPAGACSPLTDFYDGTNDRLFVGTGTGLYQTTTGSNLVTEWNVNSRLTASSTPTASATNEIGGTSGFVVDNLGTDPQTANIYFGTLMQSNGSGNCPSGDYCAVKLTRSGLN